MVCSFERQVITINKAFQEILDKTGCQPNKIWVDKSSGFYNRSMKLWQQVVMEMHSTHNEGKSAVAERLFRTLKNKIYKYMTLKLKNIYADKFDDIVNKYNTIYHGTIKIKPFDVKSST